MRITRLFALLALTTAAGATAQSEIQPQLPPLPPWGGETRALIAGADDPWITPAEQSALTETPTYDETVAFARRLVDASPDLAMVSIGKSAQGRDIWLLIAAGGASDAAAVRANGKPTLLVQAGIHAGEIDGKDAGLMLLRDLTMRSGSGSGKDDEGLLDRVNLLFVPILSVDGHERSSRFNRVNQRGPKKMGWRTNARNLNLNRDYAKLDTEEIRAVVGVINDYQPDLYVDVHVTNGEDYQYDVTYGWTFGGWSPSIRAWLDSRLRPFVDAELEAAGHVPGPLVLSVNQRDLSDGFTGWTAPPRFSNGYGDARHLPTILVENHSLKPYDQRVLGTYVFLESVLELLAGEGESLAQASAADRALRPETVPLAFTPGPDSTIEVDFAGIDAVERDSEISGGKVLDWTGEPVALKVKRVLFDQPTLPVRRPERYTIPAARADIAERLEMHGIEVERLDEPLTGEVEMLRLPEARLADADSSQLVGKANPFEGHARVDPGTPVVERHTRTFAPGSFIVDTNQPLGTLAMLLLEPQSPDSFFQWGFFLEILSRTEYADDDVMERTAQKMLDEDPMLAAAFEEALTDLEFAADPQARLDWFYRRTPWYDAEYLLYPVARSLPDVVNGES